MSDNEQLIATPGVFGDNGNFLLERELGRGGMGGVYMGRDKMLDRPVAVKVMLKEYGSDEEFVSKFKKEAQAAAKLIHPNIAQIYSYGISQGMPYIAMELVAGGSLQQVMTNAKDGKTDIPRVLKICEQTAQALRAAADQGLVHGDIKPDNILLDFNGNAKLVDFGLAGMQKDTNEIWGTPYYIAPEKLKKQPVDYRADMYNLGGTLYHALTGVAPFEGPDATAVVRKRFEGKPKKPSEIRPEIPPAVDALVMKMLELDKNDRYPTFEALLEAFKKVMATGLSKDRKTGRIMTIRKTRHITNPNLKEELEGEEKKKEGEEEPQNQEGEASPENGEKNAKAGKKGGKTKTSKVKYETGEEDAQGNPMGKVMLFTGIIIAVIVLCIGGGIFYFYATAKAQAEKEHNQIVKTVKTAKQAIGETCHIAEKFRGDFEEFARKATEECEKATKKVAETVPEFASRLKPAPSAELLEAIALTNSTASAEGAPTNAVAAASAAAEVKQAKAKTKTKSAPVTQIKRFRPPTDDEADEASPEHEEYLRKKKEFEEEQQRLAKKGGAVAQQDDSDDDSAEEKKSEESSEETADTSDPDDTIAKLRAQLKKVELKYKREIALVGEDAVKDVNELWNRAYSCQASVIKIGIGVDKVLEAGKKAESLNDYTPKTAKALSELSGEVLELYNEVKGSKEVENVQKGISFIKAKGAKSLKQASDNLYRRRAETDREIKKLQYQIEIEIRNRNNTEAHKRLVAEEQEAAKAKFEAIQQNKNFELLAWDAAIKDIDFMKSNFKTTEGQLAADEQNKKVKSMKAVQEIIVRNLKGYQFKKNKLGRMKATVVDANMIDMHLTRPEGGDSRKTVKFNLNWVKFYKEYHANFNELIIQFIEKGRTNGNPKLTLQEWGDAMCGAALTLRLICADDAAAAARGEQIAKDVAKSFPEYVKTLRKVFPDITFEDVDAEAE